MKVIESSKRKNGFDEDIQSELMFKLKYSTNSYEMELIFNQLYNNLTKVLWNSLSRKYIPPLNHDEMKDVFQDAWIKILESRKLFDDNKKVYTWVYTIFKNMIIDRIRYFDRKKTQSIDNSTDDREDNVIQYRSDRSSDADFTIEKNEKLFHIKKAINELDDDIDKTIIIMRIVEQKKIDEMSKLLNLPIATIHYKLTKSLDKLRLKLNFLLN